MVLEKERKKEKAAKKEMKMMKRKILYSIIYVNTTECVQT